MNLFFSLSLLPVAANKVEVSACRKKRKKKESCHYHDDYFIAQINIRWHFIFACSTSPCCPFYVSVAIWFNYFLNHLCPHETASMNFLFIFGFVGSQNCFFFALWQAENWNGKFRSSDSSKSLSINRRGNRWTWKALKADGRKTVAMAWKKLLWKFHSFFICNLWPLALFSFQFCFTAICAALRVCYFWVEICMQLV